MSPRSRVTQRDSRKLIDFRSLLTPFSFRFLQDSNKSLESILGLKTLARNVKKITGVNSNSQENLDDSMRKVPTTPSSKYVNHHLLTHPSSALLKFLSQLISLVTGSRGRGHASVAGRAARGRDPAVKGEAEVGI